MPFVSTTKGKTDPRSASLRPQDWFLGGVPSHLQRNMTCASSKWFLRNRSRATMQSSRARDRSDLGELEGEGGGQRERTGG